MPTPIEFDEIGRLPLPGDNVAIATRRLEAGTRIRDGAREFVLSHTVLEGHRFAVAAIAADAPLLSWELPFGYALHALQPGDYVVNASTLHALRGRSLDATLPDAPNFVDRITPYQLDKAAFQPAAQVTTDAPAPTFDGYARPGGRGVGTRNTIVLLGVSARAGGFVRQLEAQLADVAGAYANIDGVAAVAHTEGVEPDPNNLDMVLRTLAGFMVNPNVGAVLAVDTPGDTVTGAMLRSFMHAHGYPLEHVPHAFLTLDGGFAEHLTAAEATVRGWLPEVNATARTPQPISALKIALQCGGSDAFSGVSGNPLAAWVAREVVRHGGSANLAETDELIGAESYVLQKVRDLATAEQFLAMVARFQAWAAQHGTSAEGNPSGGNKLRGLYNITLKSIGAAMKRDPQVRLDAVIDYGAPMTAPGYYFMDSPGNDLESIAGQVAGGCNLIFFVTGNGSITNFPFVPTIKIVTTTARFELLHNDMDVNAGAYLDGTPMDELGAATLELTRRVAGGARTVGERAGHAQVQLWRNWRGGTAAVPAETGAENGQPIPCAGAAPDPLLVATVLATVPTLHGDSAHRVGLILPTSLCAGQIGQMAARRLNHGDLARRAGVDEFVALVHTEGCGCSPAAKDLATDTLLGYLEHPAVAQALLLEHGCEITHNDHMRQAMAARGIDPAQLGWASIQLDGGIQAVLEKIEAWFAQGAGRASKSTIVPLTTRTIALASVGALQPESGRVLARLAGAFVARGGSIIVPAGDGLLRNETFRTRLRPAADAPSLAYAQRPAAPGFHIMATPTASWAEIVVGLGASGAEAALVVTATRPVEGHPLLPVVQVGDGAAVADAYAADLDGVLSGFVDADLVALGALLAGALSGRVTPAAARNGDVAFQLTRGLVGISL
ncbi:MAG: UxaA family hydrolase [Caldilineaceae bacterium]|nr:UxaA family hydrolase [Caldilineaceae bacterium]